jgi:hypothetical protein
MTEEEQVKKLEEKVNILKSVVNSVGKRQNGQLFHIVQENK